MKLTTKTLMILLIPALFFMTSCENTEKKDKEPDHKKGQEGEEFCYEFNGRPDNIALTYTEMIAMLRQYDETKVDALRDANRGKDETRVNFFKIEDLKNYLAYVEKLSQDKGIKLTGINIISAAYPDDYEDKEKRNQQTLIFMPTTEVRGKIDVSFDPIYSKKKRPMPLARLLWKRGYKNKYIYGAPFQKMMNEVDPNKASILSIFQDGLGNGDESSAANKMGTTPPM